METSTRFMTILEDQNKNRKVDEEEYDSARYIMNKIYTLPASQQDLSKQK